MQIQAIEQANKELDRRHREREKEIQRYQDNIFALTEKVWSLFFSSFFY